MLRLGLVDFDSSHCVEFTRRINHVVVDREQFAHGASVVLACPGSSVMAPERIAGHLPQVVECGVELVSEPTDLLGRIDGVLILSIDGAAHRQRAEPFLKAGIPVFVDKPFACSASDAHAMFSLAQTTGTLLWTSSGMRFATEVLAFTQSSTARESSVHGALHGVWAHGPAKHHPLGNPGLFHYGIHAVETLWTLMGPGCVAVTASSTPAADQITLEWNDGRLAGLRGIRTGHTGYGFVAFCEHGILGRAISTRDSYRNLCQAIIHSFETRHAPVPPTTTLELITAIEAMQRSIDHGGARELVQPPPLS